MFATQTTLCFYLFELISYELAFFFFFLTSAFFSFLFRFSSLHFLSFYVIFLLFPAMIKYFSLLLARRHTTHIRNIRSTWMCALYFAQACSFSLAIRIFRCWWCWYVSDRQRNFHWCALLKNKSRCCHCFCCCCCSCMHYIWKLSRTKKNPANLMEWATCCVPAQRCDLFKYHQLYGTN